jgi:hypothetical protein
MDRTRYIIFSIINPSPLRSANRSEARSKADPVIFNRYDYVFGSITAPNIDT